MKLIQLTVFQSMNLFYKWREAEEAGEEAFHSCCYIDCMKEIECHHHDYHKTTEQKPLTTHSINHVYQMNYQIQEDKAVYS